MAFALINDVATFLDESGGRQTARPVTVLAAAPTTFPVVIANGASLSGFADLGLQRLQAIVFPAAWTNASMTFQVSDDGTTYYDLYDDATERAIASGSVVASRWLELVLQEWLAPRFLKIRSGSSASPVNQGGARTIKLIAG